MRRIVALAFPGVQTLDLTGPAEVFAAANRELGRTVYRLEFRAAGAGAIVTSCGLEVRARPLAGARLDATTTVLVPGGEEAALAPLVRDRAVLAFVRAAAARAGRLASVCSGAFVLAAAGVLDGHPAATHWSAADRLARFRPAVRVDREAIFVRSGKLWTSAGVTTGIDMALAIVEEDHGRRVAQGVAARLVLYVRRAGLQSQFSDALIAQRDGVDPLADAIAWARGHLAELDVFTLARRAGLSERTLHRRCHEHLGHTPRQLIERLRVEHARALAARALPQKVLAARAGFRSEAQMRRAFQRVLGLGPRAYAAVSGGSPGELSTRRTSSPGRGRARPGTSPRPRRASS